MSVHQALSRHTSSVDKEATLRGHVTGGRSCQHLGVVIVGSVSQVGFVAWRHLVPAKKLRVLGGSRSVDALNLGFVTLHV